MLQQRMNISTLLPLQGKECFGGFCYVHTTNSMSIAARDWYIGKSLPNFPTVFRYLCVHFPYFSAALAAGHNLNIKKSINRAAMRTKEEKENVRIQEVQLYRKLL